MSDHERFFGAYAEGGTAPWDIGRPQPAIIEAGERGWVHGSVLDVGCGTGENSLHFAAQGHCVVGTDIVPEAIERARDKAALRGLADRARFVVGDIFHDAHALELCEEAAEVVESSGGASADDRTRRSDAGSAAPFDTVIDMGFFHTLDDDERTAWATLLAELLKPGGSYVMMCFSELVGGDGGPRRVSEAEIRGTFTPEAGFRVADLERTKLDSVREGAPSKIEAWLAHVKRA